MPVELTMERRPYGFRVVDGDDDWPALFPVGAVVRAKITRHKSKPMFRLYWRLVQTVAEGIGTGKDDLSDELQWRLKSIDAFDLLRGGGTRVTLKSLAKMGHEQFKSYFDAALELICGEYLGGMPPGEMLKQAEELAGITYSQAFKQGD